MGHLGVFSSGFLVSLLCLLDSGVLCAQSPHPTWLVSSLTTSQVSSSRASCTVPPGPLTLPSPLFLPLQLLIPCTYIAVGIFEGLPSPSPERSPSHQGVNWHQSHFLSLSCFVPLPASSWAACQRTLALLSAPWAWLLEDQVGEAPHEVH